VKDRIKGFKDKINIKEKTRRIFRQKTQELRKEYARTQKVSQKTKSVNKGY
jgi:hypothetical protein